MRGTSIGIRDVWNGRLEPPRRFAPPLLIQGGDNTSTVHGFFPSLSVTIHSPRPLAGEGPGVRAVDSTTYPLTLALSPWSGLTITHIFISEEPKNYVIDY